MPSLSDHQSNDFVKVLLVGQSMSGKTGALVSLVKAGYKLRIIDTDNKLAILKYIILHECPDKINNVESILVRDKYKPTVGGTMIDGKPKAWIQALNLCNEWKDGEINHGHPATWGPDYILIIDSLSRLCDACFAFHEVIIPRGKSGDFDGRAVYGNAQKDMEKFLASLTSDSMATNVVVTAHVSYQDQPDGTTKGFPQGIGQKLSPIIPQYFPSAVLFTNKNGKRTIQTNSVPLMDLANPAPFAMAPSYPIETGLADFFAVLRKPPLSEPAKVAKPTSLTLRRA